MWFRVKNCPFFNIYIFLHIFNISEINDINLMFLFAFFELQTVISTFLNTFQLIIIKAFTCRVVV